MSEKKVVGRNVAIILGVVIIILLAGLVGAIANYTTIMREKDNTITTQNSTITSLNSQILTLTSQKNQLQTWLGGNITSLNSSITSLKSQISSLNSTITSLQTEPYVYSQLLRCLPTNISAYSSVGGWVMNWTPTTNVRVIRIQVWMGNPANVTWEGDTYVTIGKPSDPSNPNSYNNTIQLLVHYAFDSHAPSNAPTQLMFDLTPGFQVASGQTIYVARYFVNIEPHWVESGDVQVIIYYENA